MGEGGGSLLFVIKARFFSVPAIRGVWVTDTRRPQLFQDNPVVRTYSCPGSDDNSHERALLVYLGHLKTHTEQ